ncbi:MAG: DNA-binding protein WhiA [Firmicutes bacterium]|nr:DNA-binding protein WhiA [Bacillota bacterium]
MSIINKAKHEIQKKSYSDQDAASVANTFYYNASGSVTKGYHVEFSFDNYDTAKDFSETLAAYDMFPKLMERNEKVFVYLKSGECLCNLLALIGAGNALMDLHNEIALRTVRNNANRAANCDTANIQKQIDAAKHQIEFITNLAQSGALGRLSPKLQETALARLDNPDASYDELAKILCITKSGIVNRLKKIME